MIHKVVKGNLAVELVAAGTPVSSILIDLRLYGHRISTCVDVQEAIALRDALTHAIDHSGPLPVIGLSAEVVSEPPASASSWRDRPPLL